MEDNNQALKPDYTLKTMEERAAHVRKMAAQPNVEFTQHYLEYLSDYILAAMPKTEKREREILTENRLITINKRETSYENLVSHFETGEDGMQRIITDDPNKPLVPKIEITADDAANVPGLADLRKAIQNVEEQAKTATGKRKYALKRQLIEMRRDQYALKNSHLQPIASTPAPAAYGHSKIDLNEERWVDESGEPQSRGLITFFNPAHISAILNNYEGLKKQTEGAHQDDFFYLLQDFKRLMDKALKPYPAYQELVRLKLDQVTNAETARILAEKFNMRHTPEYISKLWNVKIPTLMADQEKRDFLIWYFTTVETGEEHWKICSRCKMRKPAHHMFFSRNNSSKSGFYSLCKDCRNKK